MIKGIRIKLSFIILEFLIVLQFLYPVADLIPSYVQIFVFAVWLFVEIRNTKLIGKAINLSYISIIIFLVTLFRCVVAGQLDMGYYSSLQVVIARYQFLIYPILYIYVSNLEQRLKQKVFVLSIVCISITVLFSLYYVLFVDPQAIRNTQRSYLWGVGDFQLMYSIAIFIGPLLFLIIDKIKSRKRCINLIFSFLLMTVCLILCNLVTSVVIAVFSVFITYCITRKRKLIYVFVGGASVLLIAFRGFIAKLLYFLAGKKLFYWSTNNKIIAIANLLMGNMSEIDTLSRRMMLIGQSLQSFMENPLFGINFKNHVKGRIGCHSQWADDLGRYGILGNFLIWINYYKIAKYTINHNQSLFVKKMMLSVWLTFFVLGFLNPCLSGTILMIMFVVVPTFDSV